MYKRILIRIVMKLLDGVSGINYREIDKRAFEEWAYRSFDDKGWRSYFAYEDMKILKELSFGKDRDAYMVLIGRRIQLLYLFDEMKKAVENRISAQEKKASESKTDNEQP